MASTTTSKIVLLSLFVNALCDFQLSTKSGYFAEYEALVDLYKSTNGSGWRTNNNWLQKEDYCTWVGVSCYGTGAVMDLSLYNNQLSGTIPSSISNLNSLIALSLQGNQLYGTLPESLGQISTLRYIFLQSNTLDGMLPSTLYLLNNLEYLFIGHNKFSTLPDNFQKPVALKFCDLTDNPLLCPIPKWIKDMCDAKCVSNQ